MARNFKSFVIVSYNMQPNTYRDVKLLKDYLDIKEKQDKKQDLFTDVEYFDQDLVDEAKEKDIDMS